MPGAPLPPAPTAGLLLAAGAGRRFGMPKALARTADGTPWAVRSARALHQGGCDRVTVVVGAAAEEVSALLAVLPEVTELVRADDWDEGMAASLRAGLEHLTDSAPEVQVALVHLVDLPDVGPAVIDRLRRAATGPDVLARAAYAGRPGHPVLLGRDHWPAVCAGATGDRGARDHLAHHPHRLVECGDLASGHDRDRPEPTPDQRPAP